jgi:hypothetical protein
MSKGEMFNVKKIKSLGLAVALFYQALISWCGRDIICVTSFSGAAQWPMRARGDCCMGAGCVRKGFWTGCDLCGGRRADFGTAS